MLPILITGSNGRMGKTVREAVEVHPNALVGATHDLGDSLKVALLQADCVIDFTIHEFTDELLSGALQHRKPLVIGTTGHSEAQKKSIKEASKELPIVYAPNFSIGVNTLFWLTRKATEILGNERWDIEVTEMHHKHKVDSPSGTARRLLEILNAGTNTNYEEDVKHGRVGNIGARPSKEIGMHTLRGGDVVGDHTVLFAADGERLELTHKASSRQTFATGAVEAAVWLQDKDYGLYDMQDVLNLR